MVYVHIQLGLCFTSTSRVLNPGTSCSTNLVSDIQHFHLTKLKQEVLCGDSLAEAASDDYPPPPPTLTSGRGG